MSSDSSAFYYFFYLFEPVRKLICLWKQKYGANVNKSSSLEIFFVKCHTLADLKVLFYLFEIELQSTLKHYNLLSLKMKPWNNNSVT